MSTDDAASTIDPLTRSFLFTDIEGSTRQWEEQPTMQAQVHEHFAVLRAAVAAQNGEIFATMGDGIAAAFTSASAAVSAAVAAQRDLEPVGLRVRMGIHTGEVSRTHGNFLGRAVNRAARIMSLGHGGQILLSDLAASLVRQGSHPVEVHDLGLYELKGLSQLERIWQVVDPSLPSTDRGPHRSSRPHPGGIATTRDDSPDGAFIGRADALATIGRALELARAGASSTLLVSGEAGIGKTRLVTEWQRRARSGSAVVFTGSCMQLLAARVPYAPIVEALRRLAHDRGVAAVRSLLGPGRHAVSRLLPELEPVAMRDEVEAFGQGQLFEAVLELLTRVAPDGPAMLVVEDLHWADMATLDLLNFLVRNVVGHGVILVATMRSELPPDHPLRLWATELSRLKGVECIDLAPFGRAEVFELLTEREGAPPDPAVAEEIYRRSGGNAFFAEELHHAVDQGGVLPPTLRATLLARASVLRPPTQRMLKQLSTGGGRVAHELLAAVSGTDENTLLASLDEAVTAHIIVIDGDGYAFRHAAFCEAIYSSLVPAERRGIHASFGEVLAQRLELGGPAERAAHWVAVGDAERALPATIDAAIAADGQHAPAEALRYWEQALALWASVPDPGELGVDRVELLDRAAEAANRSGSFDQALEWIDAALADVDGERDRRREAHLDQRRGWYLSRSGRDDEALAAYDRTLQLLAGEPVSSEQTRALAAKGRLLARRGDAAGARRACEEALAGAVGASATAEEGYARHALGLALAAGGEVDAAFDELVRAAHVAAAAGEVVELAWACTDLQQVGGRAGRRQEAVDVALHLADRGHRAGLGRTYGGLLECIAAGGLVELGRWAEASRMTDVVTARGPNGIEAIALAAVQGTLDVGRGRFAEAAEHLRAAQGFTLWLRDGRLSGLTSDGLAELARWTGRYDEALATVLEGLAREDHTGDDEMLARLCLTGVRIAADRGPTVRPLDPGESEILERLRGLARRIERRDGPWGEIQAAACTAEAEHRRGIGVLDIDRWEQAVTAWHGLSMPYPEAMARLRLAEAMLAAGRRSEGEAETLRAHAAAITLDAAPLRRSIEELARRSHVALEKGGVARRHPRDPPVGCAKRKRINRRIGVDRPLP